MIGHVEVGGLLHLRLGREAVVGPGGVAIAIVGDAGDAHDAIVDGIVGLGLGLVKDGGVGVGGAVGGAL